MLDESCSERIVIATYGVFREKRPTPSKIKIKALNSKSDNIRVVNFNRQPLVSMLLLSLLVNYGAAKTAVRLEYRK